MLAPVPASDRPMPDIYHARTGHVLPPECSGVYNQLLKTEKYAADNQMELNYKKTKLMVFNPCRSLDFMPQFQLGGESCLNMLVYIYFVSHDIRYAQYSL